MGALDRMPAPPAAVSRVLSRFDRPALEGFISVALDLLDFADGDADAEPNGDEADGQFAEDEPASRFARMGDGPGCIIADPDEGIDDKGQDDINDDREEEHHRTASYVIDQTKGPLPPH